ncbi:MAG: transposase [Gemmatimonadaceae bacterium]|nr:transposase [Gemmatimonadaceae bacterium]
MTRRTSRTRSRYQRWSAGAKARYLAAQRRSGESVRVFCARVGVPHSTFTWWQREARARRATAPQFARVQVVPSATAPTPAPLVVLRAANGVALEVAGLDVATPVAVLRGVARAEER